MVNALSRAFHIYEYGPTETTVAVCAYPITHSTLVNLEVNAPIGIVDKKVSYYILDENKQPVPQGQVGELHIGGVCLARGYLNQLELTQEKFIPNPFTQDNYGRLYKTGDLCKELPNGVLECLGRIDQQVKVNGFRIQLEEIEKCLAEHPRIKDVIVLVKENLLHEKQLVAYYIPHSRSVASDIKHF